MVLDGHKSLFRSAEKKSVLKRATTQLLLLAASFGAVGCVVQSPEPEVEDIIKVVAPTFGGSYDAFISSPSQTYTLTGECDPQAKFTEYSYDQVTWTAISCVNGRFNIPITLMSYQDVWARSSGKFSLTRVSHARVRFLLPPTSDSIVAGNSSKSASSDSVGAGTQNMLAATFEGNALQGGGYNIQTLLPRMVYEP